MGQKFPRLMTLVMPHDKLSQIVGKTQLLTSNEMPIFLRAINHACLILGIVVLFAIIPSLLRGPKNPAVTAAEKAPKT